MYKDVQVELIGIGMGHPDVLTMQAQTAIDQADAIVGAGRMLEIVSEDSTAGKGVYSEYRSAEILRLIQEHPEYKKWAVLMSGDIGFYSGAKKLLEVFAEAGITGSCIPGISSVVYLAAKLGRSWEDAALRSIHGRSQNVIAAIRRHKKTFLLLDKKHAEEFCRDLRTYGLSEVICYIGTRLSYAEERITVKKGWEMNADDIDGLSTLLVVNPAYETMANPHVADEAFLRNQEGKTIPMTKEEVRAVSLAKLNLASDSVVYDIGAGTGSVSVEAARHGENVKVYAIEQREDACKLIEENKKRFGLNQIKVIQGAAPEALEELEEPTHAFIGGSSGQLLDIIRSLKNRNPEVKLVINAISLETVGEVMEAIKQGLLDDPEIVQMTVAKSRTLGRYHMMTGQNPIYIITE